MSAKNVMGFIEGSILISLLIWLPVLSAKEFPNGVNGTVEQHVYLFELGKTPQSAGEKANPNVSLYKGEVDSHSGEDYISTEDDEVISAKSGFGEWSIQFRFELNPALKSGKYRLFARWKQGGDPAVCQQTFGVFAGSDKSKMESRGSFTVSYSAAWKFEWVAVGIVMIEGTDTLLGIRNTGKAHDAKVFDAFILVKE